MKTHRLLTRELLTEEGIPALASALRRMRPGGGSAVRVARIAPDAGGVWGRRLLAAACALLFVLVAGTLLHQRLSTTLARLDAAGVRLSLAEARQAEAEQRAREAAALVKRFRHELDALRTEGAARLAAQQAELRKAFAGQVAALRALPDAPGAPGGAERADFKRIFAQAREATLYIRTSYTVRMLETGEERELSSYGSGFLISPVGVALTAQHVVFPWRYDRRVQASQAMGMLEVLEDSVNLTVWLADRPVTEGDGGDAPFLVEQAYQGGPGQGAVRILYEGPVDWESELIVSPVGPLEVRVPLLGTGDLVALQLVDPGRRFPYLALGSAHEPAPLDEVLVVGYPLSRLQEGRAVPQAATGRVRRAGGSVMELDTSLHPGNSGGPILDREGRVVGMASAILDSPVYGIAVQGRELLAAWRAVQAQTAATQQRLRATGCDPGAIDGIPGARTLAAMACAERSAAGL